MRCWSSAVVCGRSLSFFDALLVVEGAVRWSLELLVDVVRA